jgi:oxygen-independent coproporphyrinogen-3 oxidase
MNKEIALYIHFPFCRRKCRYCSFVSYQDRAGDIPKYFAVLKRELALCVPGKNLRTIYFGGGTPSLASSRQLADILSTIRSLCNIDEEAEITLEANPGTVDKSYLAAIKQIGINRISLGVQSFNDDELSLLGRIHSAQESREAVQLAVNSGFTNINIDLIYGIPGQTLSDWQKNVIEAMKLDAEHISLYALTLEGDEPMALTIEQGELPALNPDLCAEQYELAEDILATHGYQHYEISNWAKEGFECHHNLVYWHNHPYIGIGAAAHSYIGNHRLANVRNLDQYLGMFEKNTQPVSDLNEEIGDALKLSESIILGLRLNRGVSVDDIHGLFGINLLSYYGKQVNSLTSSGLLEIAEGNLRLTRRGRLLGNEVFWQFLPA